jgi:hypothetical protein
MVGCESKDGHQEDACWIGVANIFEICHPEVSNGPKVGFYIMQGVFNILDIQQFLHSQFGPMGNHNELPPYVLQEPCHPLVASLPHYNTKLVHYNHQNNHKGAGVY